MKQIIRIGTRKSRLAMVQTELVVKEITRCFPEQQVEVIPMSTKGDQIQNKSLASFGGKGVFTKELEEALLCKKIDMAVHSAKDMPMEFPKGLGIGAVLDREDPRDVLVTMNGTRASELPKGSIIGTSSLRREILMKQMNSGVKIRVLRGNVQTRLKRLSDGDYDGILLAAAGLKRLQYTELEEYHVEYLNPEQFLPAAGQGILTVECRMDDEDLKPILEAIHSKEACCVLQAERSFLSAVDGSCNAPAAAYCRKEGNELFMQVMYQKEGIYEKRAEGRGTITRPEVLGQRLAKQVNFGMVYLVGAGPGDPGLLTIRALNLVQRADTIVYDNLAASSVLNESRSDAELIYAGKEASNHHMKQEEINELLVEKAKEGKMVVRLKGGDPFIFGRGGEEAAVLADEQVPFEIVPGISSAYAVPAYAGIPVTDRRAASSFHVITGHEKSQEGRLDYSVLAREEGTLVFLMGLHNLHDIANSLIEHGKDPLTPAAVIQEGTTARQRKVVGTLSTIEEIVKQKNIGRPAITIVGSVVSFEQALDWYGKRFLSGKSVLITATKRLTDKMAERLNAFGAQPIPFSLIETKSIESEEVDQAFQRLGDYQWIVLTSANGVEILFKQLKKRSIDVRSLSFVKFAVIGDGTKEALSRHGIYADFVPTNFSSEDLKREWIPHIKPGERVLLLRAREASHVLTEALKVAQIDYLAVSLYETSAQMRKKEELKRSLAKVDYVTLLSASAAKALASMVEAEDLSRVKVLSIGPVTTKKAQQLGIPVYATARHYSVEGLIELLREE